MTENEYKRQFMLAMMPYGFEFQAHEDMYGKFVPDLSFSAHNTDGWIEVKYVPTPPKTLDDIKHYTKGQEKWLIDRGNRGSGNCYLLVGSPDRHILWKWSSIRAVRKLDWAMAVQFASINTYNMQMLTKEFNQLIRLP
jgi:hypothetical protein